MIDCPRCDGWTPQAQHPVWLCALGVTVVVIGSIVWTVLDNWQLGGRR